MPAMTKLDLMAGLLGVLLLIVYRITLHATRDAGNDFNFSQAFLDTNGKTSMARICLFGAFIISSWAMVAMVVSDELSEWFLTGYLGAFVINGVGSKFMETKNADTVRDTK
jgi:hypothetical protein